MRSLVALTLLAACRTATPPPSNSVAAKPVVHVTIDLRFHKPFATRPMTITIRSDRAEVHEIVGAQFRKPVRIPAPHVRVGDHYLIEVDGMSRDGCNRINGAYAGVVETFEVVIDPEKAEPGVSRTEMSCVGMDDGSDWGD